MMFTPRLNVSSLVSKQVPSRSSTTATLQLLSAFLRSSSQLAALASTLTVAKLGGAGGGGGVTGGGEGDDGGAGRHSTFTSSTAMSPDQSEPRVALK